MDEGVRLDKWLWAARFYKTRAVAADAVKGGFVRLAGQRTKPSRGLGVGDELQISTQHGRFVVQVLALVAHRRPAAEAALLYVETEESRAERARLAAQQRLTGVPPGSVGPRPTKRDRRRFEATPGTRRGRR